MENRAEVIEKIKGKKWELRVKRPGFLQSKHIVSRAITQEVQLTKSVVVRPTSNIWINTANLYDQRDMDQLVRNIFPAAFKEDRDWPLKIIEQLKQARSSKDEFIGQLRTVDWQQLPSERVVKYINDYVRLLFDIQKYYAFAATLTNHCEEYLRANDNSLLEFAVQYEMLDVDRMNRSLLNIKQAKENRDGAEADKLVQNHLQEFGWIKTNYNIVEEYTAEEVLSEIKSSIHVFEPQAIPSGEHRHFAVALQVGIYLRNSMKEMSQQLWFAYDFVAAAAARLLTMSKNDFLQLTSQEAIASLEAGRLLVKQEEIHARHRGFVVGVVDDQDIVITGSEIHELYELFASVETKMTNEFKGNIACKGLVIGTAKVIANIREIDKLNEGDILVTCMTTPDFVVAMKKAGAIVTDEGGLSCHAAIVSRELKKPCIIGTKIATQVLKDGDQVEVDANNGVVRRI